MKTTAVIWFSLFCFGINLQQGFGQTFFCSERYFYRDADGDGFGTRNVSQQDRNKASFDFVSNQGIFRVINNVGYGCLKDKPAWFVSSSNDIDDNNACITNIAPQHFYLDADGDGFGDPATSVYCSSPPANYVNNTTDNCDNNPATLVELTWYQDADGDGVGGSISQQACVQPPGYVSSTGDACDNNSATLVVLTWYQDADGDGVGGSISQQACVQPPGYVSSTGDACDNNSATLVVLTWYQDADGDGVMYPTCGFLKAVFLKHWKPMNKIFIFWNFKIPQAKQVLIYAP